MNLALITHSGALRNLPSQMLLIVGSNLTATSGGISFQSSEAKNLLNQSFHEYHTAEQMFQSKDYAAALQHAQKALDLIHQAQTKENQYQQQQLLARIAEIAAALAVPVACAVTAASYLRRRKLSASRRSFCCVRRAEITCRGYQKFLQKAKPRKQANNAFSKNSKLGRLESQQNPAS